ncbi:hypothetical protein [Plantactinospora sp. WMMB782]|uniref:hypothetical protein n=1 Tax=Plantactinospora sp. WMMB782 TaxID=3404121 RepID=UPI003B962D27
MAKSRGVMLRARAAGLGFWRDETEVDGGKRRLRRRVKRKERRAWQREAQNEQGED